MEQHKKYAVVICKHCKKPKITETKQKILISKTVLIKQTNNLSEAQQVVGQINAKNDDCLDEFKTFLKRSH
jgi:predicted metal-binding protein